MRAAVNTRYGQPEVVQVIEVPRPEPDAGEVLVRVVAVAVTAADSRIRRAQFPRGFAVPARLIFGITRPRRTILGGSFSGVVESVGTGVTTVAPGDAVCGMTSISMGAHAEFIAVKGERLARVPDGVSHDDAAGVLFGGTTALHYLRVKSAVGPGMSVLVNGASGAIGTNAVQLARLAGATVTGVCSAANADLVTSLGAERVIDYTAVDLATIPDRFDIVFDTVGNISIAAGRRLLAPQGRLLLAVSTLWETIRARGNVSAGPAPERVEDIDELLGLVAAGDLRVVIDETFGLDHVVAAHRRVDSGHKRGSVIVRP